MLSIAAPPLEPGVKATESWPAPDVTLVTVGAPGATAAIVNDVVAEVAASSWPDAATEALTEHTAADTKVTAPDEASTVHAPGVADAYPGGTRVVVPDLDAVVDVPRRPPHGCSPGVVQHGSSRHETVEPVPVEQHLDLVTQARQLVGDIRFHARYRAGAPCSRKDRGCGISAAPLRGFRLPQGQLRNQRS